MIAPALVGAVALLIGAGFWKSPWAPLATLKHVAAAVPSCAVAEAVGVAPARQGQPGYWSHLDSDHDGIACPKQGQPQPQTASSRPKQGASIPVKQTATSTGKQTATSTAKGGQPTRGQGTAARTTAPTTQGKNTKQY